MEIEKLICSGMRQDIMRRLLDGPERLTKLRPESKKQAINTAIQPLLDDGLIVGQGGVYHLTDLGRAYALVLRNTINSAEVLQADFWKVHDLSSIPDGLLARIGDLIGGEVVCPNGDLLKAQHNFIEVVLNAKVIYGVSSVFFQEWPGMILQDIQNGAEVHLILSPDVKRKLPKEFLEAGFDLQFKPCQAAFTIADNTLSLGLFAKGGGYDPMQDFICESEKAAAWGKDLYNYYRNQ